MRRLAVLPPCALLAVACSTPETALVHDLVTLGPVADRAAAWELTLFGSPWAQPRQGSGFVQAVGQPPGHVFSWVEPKAGVELDWDDVRPRMVLLDMAAHPDLESQSVRVSLNGQALAEVRLGKLRGWHRLDIPTALQRVGENQLGFRFSNGTAPVKPHRRRLAAAVHALVVGEPDEPALVGLLARGAPAAVGATDAGRARGLVQVGPSTLEFVLRLPHRAELRFTPELHPLARAAGVAVAFRVTLQREGETEAGEVWSDSLQGAQPSEEVRVPLPPGVGTLARLGLQVAGGQSGRTAWGIWREARVMGEVGPPPARRQPPEPAVAKLRRAVAGSNVLLVVLDAARAGQLGSYGYHRPTSPEIDRIAAEGVVFDRAFTTNVYTLLAMSSLWTSLHPERHHNGIPYNSRLPKRYPTLAELLGEGGFHSAGFVSNGNAGSAYGLDRGFAEFHEVYREHGDRAGAYSEILPGWLEQNRDRRFFLYLHIREPHFPYNPLEPFDTRFGPEGPITLSQRSDLEFFESVSAGRRSFSREEVEHLTRLYDGSLAYADREVGRLRTAMEALGLWERSVVIVTADHGEALYEHGHVGHIEQLYEESVRIPLIVRFPGGSGPAGTRSAELVSLVDLAPTVADLFGGLGEGRASEAFEGRSLLPVVFGAPGRSAVFLRSSYEQPLYAIRDARHKYILATSRRREELYDLNEDPNEEQNLVARKPLRAAFYRQRLMAWILDQRGAEGSLHEAPQLAPEQLENLRALGYVR